MLTKFPYLITIFILTCLTTALNASGQVIPSVCQSQRVKLQMLGTRGSELLDGQANKARPTSKMFS